MRKVVFLGDTLLDDEPLGIQRYAYEIIKNIDDMEPSYNCELLIPNNHKCNIKFKNIEIVKYGKHKSGFLWRQIDFPKYVQKQKAISVDLTLGLSFRGNCIVCLHDCIYENYPSDFISIKQKISRYSYLIRAKNNIKKAKKIITVSQTSKNELVDYYHVNEKKVVVIYNSWQHYLKIQSESEILKKYDLVSKEFYFALGSGLPHKNFIWIAMMAKKYPDKKFVVTGTNRLSEYIDILENNELSNLIFTGFLADGEVKALMENCKAFLHPSYYEGFGIPPLEAIYCGAPIVISSQSCLPEVYGNSASYFDPDDYDVDLEKLICVKEDERRKILNKYSWGQSACILNNIILELENEIENEISK